MARKVRRRGIGRQPVIVATKVKTAIHFTEHSCVASTGQHPDKPRVSYEREYGGDSRPPESCACYRGFKGFKGNVALRRFTTDRDAVTCRSCLRVMRLNSREAWAAHIAQHGPEYSWREWLEHGEALRRAWMICCRHVGAPSPMSPAKTRATLARLDQRERIRSLGPLHTAYLDIRGLDSDDADEFGPARFRRQLVEQFEAINEDLRPALMPAMHHYMLAADLADEIQLMMNAARAIARDVIGAVRGDSPEQAAQLNERLAKSKAESRAERERFARDGGLDALTRDNRAA